MKHLAPISRTIPALASEDKGIIVGCSPLKSLLNKCNGAPL